MQTTTGSVTVLGVNPRAAAIANALAAWGHAITVWDETADDAAQALDAALIVVCVENYDALWPLLSRHEQRLAGHDIVNLTSGTEADARSAAARLTGRGARYLDGALMAHPEHVGDPHTVVVYSGSAEVFHRHESVLSALGSATYLGEDAATAALYDLAMLNFAWATLIGYLQSAALLGTDGVAAKTLTPLFTRWLRTTVAEVIEGYADQIDAGAYPGDGEWLELDYPLMDHLIRTTDARGLDSALPRVVEAVTAKGIAAGHGKDSFASLVRVLRR
ncbi:NAD(P)-dependent oxidoreductase [Allorhizocola rhizosphaerae]|uniref:imine reductase family protein n=1 Tax=Allorhizocola rhizosphaerae TaxID=1872709 RepID=UPI000E3E7B0A|nr:NAD(P)-dependent oxidoreductase [Allorhizocola rhizosphaerae]